MEDTNGTIDESFWLPNSLDSETEKGIYHSEWRDYLNSHNQKEVKRLLKDPRKSQRFVLYTRHVADFFRVAAKELLMPPEVVFQAIDIFDRFWVNYLCRSRERQKKRLNSLTQDVPAFRRDICLISLSCIQLASKQCYANKVLPIPVVVELMKTFGFNVEKKEVLFVELKIFRAIEWNMSNVSILTYIEMFVEQMTNILANTSRSELLQVCIKVLNVAHSFHKEIYTKLHIAFKQREIRTSYEKSMYLSIEGDFIRLAASVVCTSGMLYDPTNQLAELIIDHLEETTNYPKCEIQVLSQIIMHIIVRKLPTPLAQGNSRNR